MRLANLLTLVFSLFLLLAPSVLNADDNEKGIARQVTFFERKIRPVLVEKCYRCHGGPATKIKGGLRLDTPAGLLKGGDTGPVIVPGKPDESLLLKALRYDGFEMPPSGKLRAVTISDFALWIKAGAFDPRKNKVVEKKAAIDVERGRQFWSFRSPQRHKSAFAEDPWVQRQIDGFVLAQQRAHRLSPNPVVDRRTLIRRAYLDVIGLPPSPAAVNGFLANSADDAFESVVEELLASPRYGERWGRMWLDVARYAEDQAHIVGNNQALFYPNAHRYRTWVIKALNSDMAYNDFVARQLAADLLVPDAPHEHVAMGFLGLGPKYYRRNSPEVMADEWEDRVDTVTRGLLGLTVACARCHDHKYDPIPTTDYYALAGVFASTEMFNRALPGKKAGKNGQAKRPADAIHIVRESAPRDLNVMLRGDVNRKGPLVHRRFLSVLTEKPVRFDKGSGRLQLARAIASRKNPLTARVIINRIWAQYFGRGLVGTPSNFGQLGERPSHPQLLDDLAVRFMDNGWSLKWLHREILLSATYQQSSQLIPEKAERDGDNRWLSRMPRRRLSVESWRDSLLFAAGRLDARLGGESIDPTDAEETRRTVYARVSRLELNSMLALFDFPDPNAHSAARAETTTPLQKLFLLNSPFMVRTAEKFAERVGSLADDDAGRIRSAYGWLYGREPEPEEISLGQAYLATFKGKPQGGWVHYAQALMAANEMLIVD